MSTTDTQLRMLLLRRLPAAQTARLEEAILSEDGFAERLCEQEYDLLDDYAAGRLSPADSRDVELCLLTSEQTRRSLRIARALQHTPSHPPAQQGAPPLRVSSYRPRLKIKPLWRIATLLAACLAIVLYLPRFRVAPHSVVTRGATDLGVLPVIALVADVNRGTRPSLAIDARAGAIRVQAEVPEHIAGNHYALLVQDAAGTTLFTATSLEVHAAGHYRFIETVVPVMVLGPGDRTLLLTDPGATGAAATVFSWEVTGVIHQEPASPR